MEVEWAGWLNKKGAGRSIFGRTNWNKRWFTLMSNGTLSYFANAKSKKAKGVLFVRTVYIPPADTIPSGKQHYFEIRAVDRDGGRSMAVCAPSQSEMDEVVAALQRVSPDAAGKPPASSSTPASPTVGTTTTSTSNTAPLDMSSAVASPKHLSSTMDFPEHKSAASPTSSRTMPSPSPSPASRPQPINSNHHLHSHPPEYHPDQLSEHPSASGSTHGLPQLPPGLGLRPEDVLAPAPPSPPPSTSSPEEAALFNLDIRLKNGSQVMVPYFDGVDPAALAAEFGSAYDLSANSVKKLEKVIRANIERMRAEGTMGGDGSGSGSSSSSSGGGIAPGGGSGPSDRATVDSAAPGDLPARLAAARPGHLSTPDQAGHSSAFSPAMTTPDASPYIQPPPLPMSHHPDDLRRYSQEEMYGALDHHSGIPPTHDNAPPASGATAPASASASSSSSSSSRRSRSIARVSSSSGPRPRSSSASGSRRRRTSAAEPAPVSSRSRAKSRTRSRRPSEAEPELPRGFRPSRMPPTAEERERLVSTPDVMIVDPESSKRRPQWRPVGGPAPQRGTKPSASTPSASSQWDAQPSAWSVASPPSSLGGAASPAGNISVRGADSPNVPPIPVAAGGVGRRGRSQRPRGSSSSSSSITRKPAVPSRYVSSTADRDRSRSRSRSKSRTRTARVARPRAAVPPSAPRRRGSVASSSMGRDLDDATIDDDLNSDHSASIETSPVHRPRPRSSSRSRASSVGRVRAPSSSVTAHTVASQSRVASIERGRSGGVAGDSGAGDGGARARSRSRTRSNRNDKFSYIKPRIYQAAEEHVSKARSQIVQSRLTLEERMALADPTFGPPPPIRKADQAAVDKAAEEAKHAKRRPSSLLIEGVPSDPDHSLHAFRSSSTTSSIGGVTLIPGGSGPSSHNASPSPSARSASLRSPSSAQLAVDLEEARQSEARLRKIARDEELSRKKSESEVLRLQQMVRDGYAKIASVEAMADALQSSMTRLRSELQAKGNGEAAAHAVGDSRQDGGAAGAAGGAGRRSGFDSLPLSTLSPDSSRLHEQLARERQHQIALESELKALKAAVHTASSTLAVTGGTASGGGDNRGATPPVVSKSASSLMPSRIPGPPTTKTSSPPSSSSSASAAAAAAAAAATTTTSAASGTSASVSATDRSSVLSWGRDATGSVPSPTFSRSSRRSDPNSDLANLPMIENVLGTPPGAASVSVNDGGAGSPAASAAAPGGSQLLERGLELEFDDEIGLPDPMPGRQTMEHPLSSAPDLGGELVSATLSWGNMMGGGTDSEDEGSDGEGRKTSKPGAVGSPGAARELLGLDRGGSRDVGGGGGGDAANGGGLVKGGGEEEEDEDSDIEFGSDVELDFGQTF